MSEEAPLLLPEYKKGRVKFYEGRYLVAYGDRDRAVFVFKDEPARYQASRFYHRAVGHCLKIEDEDMIATVIHLNAFALLKGRGCLVQLFNPTTKNLVFNPTTKNLVTVKTRGPMGIGLAWDDNIQDEALNATYMRPLERRWINGWTFLDHILGFHNSRDYRFRTTKPIPPNEIDEALKAWAKEFVSPSCSPEMNIRYITSWLIDGMTETLVPHIKPKEMRVQKPVTQVDLSYRISQDSDPDYILPLDLDHMMKFHSPKMRKLLRSGGVKRFIETCTGTACKTMVKVMAPNLHQIAAVSFAMSMITKTDHPGNPVMVREDLLLLRPFMDTLSIDHRVRFMEIFLRKNSLGMYSDTIRDEKHVANLKEFFSIANPTKIMDKCAEATGTFEKLQSYIGDNIDPFPAMIDAGGQLLKWRGKKLNKKQQKYFPEGIKVKSRWNSIKEIHDDISKQANKLESLVDVILMPWVEKWRKLHGARCGSTKILLPRTNQVLVRWGKVQKHCVGSMYNSSMQNGEQAIVGVFVEGKLKYCARLTSTKKTHKTAEPEGNAITNEVESWHLTELRGLSNCWPDAKTSAEVLEIMLEVGIDASAWASSGNGYGKAKDGRWDEEYTLAAANVEDVVFTPKIVNNFPSARETFTRAKLIP